MSAGGDQNDEDADYLPAPSVTGPDAYGIKTYTEYKLNAKNQKVKVTRRVKVQTKTRLVSRRIAERKKWVKFGAAKGKPVGVIDTDVTLHSHEDVLIDAPFAKKKDAAEVLLDKLKEMQIKRAVGGGLRRGPRAADLEDDADTIGAPGRYVAPGRRGGAGEKMSAGEAMRGGRRQRDAALPTYQRRRAKRSPELFSCSRVTRVYLALDRETQQSRGFAFVSFYSKDDAENAMKNLQGFGYDHLILKIDWAEPSTRDPSQNNSMKYASGYGKALPQMSVKAATGR